MISDTSSLARFALSKLQYSSQIYKGNREVRTFADLAHGADVLIMKAEQEPEGRHYTTMGALILAAFTFEAYLNHLGDRTIKFWSEVESIKVIIASRRTRANATPLNLVGWAAGRDDG